MTEFTYNNSVHSATGVTLFFASTGRHLKMRLNLSPHESQAIEVTELVKKLDVIQKDLKLQLLQANEKYSTYYNDHHTNQEFKVGDRVWLNIHNIAMKKLSKKLNNKCLSPYTIIKRSGTQVYELDILKWRQIHNIFNVQLLEPVIGPNTAIMDINKLLKEEQEWEVLTLLNSWVFNETLHYLVHWKGFQEGEATWEPAGNLQHTGSKIKQFHRFNPTKAQKMLREKAIKFALKGSTTN